jgi:hypothetical protein
MCLLEEFQQSTNKITTKMEDVNTVCCNYCKENPCSIWVTNKEDMLQFDNSEHSLLTSEDIPPANLCRKGIHHRMTLAIAGGSTGKGIRMELPICFVNGVCEMFPNENDRKYMGHMED